MFSQEKPARPVPDNVVKDKSRTGLKMYLEQASRFIEYLGQRNHSMDEVLKHLTLRVLSVFGAESSVIADLQRDGTLEISHVFGISESAIHTFALPIVHNENHPLTDSIHFSKSLLIPTLPKWGVRYPELEGNVLSKSAKSFACWPIESSGTPSAVMGFFFSKKVTASSDTVAFFNTLGQLIALYFYHNSSHAGGSNDYSRKRALEAADPSTRFLTQRQLLILKMMSEGMTNLAIAENLNYSESTVRQESIKIYSKLGCYGRHEAAQIFREEFAEKI